jgi:hypothetical protein
MIFHLRLGLQPGEFSECLDAVVVLAAIVGRQWTFLLPADAGQIGTATL